MLQRVPFAESGCKERYFERSKFPKRESNNISELHTEGIVLQCLGYDGSAHYSAEVSMTVRTFAQSSYLSRSMS